jgi:hypothetical protein
MPTCFIVSIERRLTTPPSFTSIRDNGGNYYDIIMRKRFSFPIFMIKKLWAYALQLGVVRSSKLVLYMFS